MRAGSALSSTGLSLGGSPVRCRKKWSTNGKGEWQVTACIGWQAPCPSPHLTMLIWALWGAMRQPNHTGSVGPALGRRIQPHTPIPIRLRTRPIGTSMGRKRNS